MSGGAAQSPRGRLRERVRGVWCEVLGAFITRRRCKSSDALVERYANLTAEQGVCTSFLHDGAVHRRGKAARTASSSV